MNSLKFFIFISSIIYTHLVFAKIEVLFHPTDPTLPKIAQWLNETKHTIDIAMYSLETGSKSEVILALASDDTQKRILSGDLKIRVIYEGYGTPAQNNTDMTRLKALGADIRFLTSSKHVHHKFAVLDAGFDTSRVISGSANWSLASYHNYDENILFFDQEPIATANFKNEFELLWTHSTAYRTDIHHATIEKKAQKTRETMDQIKTYFNSNRHLLKDPSPEHNITHQVISLIDQAQTDLSIATTRARTTTILDALLKASQRGVKIKILLNQDDYHDLFKRAHWLLDNANIELRIKFYNLNPANFMIYQMHNKFMIIDHKAILTGSFNWSDSSENSFIENIIVLKSDKAQQVLPAYEARFDLLWQNGRASLPGLQEKLLLAQGNHSIPECSFPAISLNYTEAKSILELAPKCIP